MTDRPIIFSAPMVNALRAGRKTQTRRLAWSPGKYLVGRSPRAVWQDAKPGDRLWVRESVRAEECVCDGFDGVRYAADHAWRTIDNSQAAADAWLTLFHYRGRGRGRIGHPVPSIHMPRWVSRLTLLVTAVRIERLRDISEEDAEAEGAPRLAVDDEGKFCEIAGGTHHCGFVGVWQHIHGRNSWDENPEVVAITFQVQHRNIDKECG